MKISNIQGLPRNKRKIRHRGLKPGNRPSCDCNIRKLKSINGLVKIKSQGNRIGLGGPRTFRTGDHHPCLTPDRSTAQEKKKKKKNR